MKVKLLSVTPNATEVLFAAARQCYSDGWVGDVWDQADESSRAYVSKSSDPESVDFTEEEMNKLIKHIKNSGHLSILEHVKFTFAFEGLSRAATHQLVRSRVGVVFSQQSQRYVDMSGDFNINNFVIPPSIEKNPEAKKIYEEALNYLQDKYNRLSELGIPGEDSRFVLPNGTKSNVVMSMNCTALLNFFGQRSCTLAQWEIRKLSNAMLKVCKDNLPVVFENSGSKCINLGYCPESKARCCGKYPVKEDVLRAYEYDAANGYESTKGICNKGEVNE